MALIGASITFDFDQAGFGYLDIDLSIDLGALLQLDLSIGSQPSGLFFNITSAGAIGDLLPIPDGELLGTILPPLLAPDPGAGGIFTDEIEPPAGSTSIIDLGGTVLNLPGLFS